MGRYGGRPNHYSEEDEPLRVSWANGDDIVSVELDDAHREDFRHVFEG
jgi:hypothetical protein